MEVESWAQNKIRRLSQNHMQLWNRRFKVLVALESILCNELTMGTAYSTNCVTSKNGKLSSHIDWYSNSFKLTIKTNSIEGALTKSHLIICLN